MNRKKMDAKRLKMLKAAFVKLREAANLINKVNIRDEANYDVPVLGVALSSFYKESRLEVHLNSIETLEQLAGDYDFEPHLGPYKKAVYNSGELTLFALMPNPEYEEEHDDDNE